MPTTGSPKFLRAARGAMLLDLDDPRGNAVFVVDHEVELTLTGRDFAANVVAEFSQADEQPGLDLELGTAGRVGDGRLGLLLDLAKLDVLSAVVAGHLSMLSVILEHPLGLSEIRGTADFAD